MDAIKKEVAKLKAAEEAGKAQRKAEKRAKKEAKAARKAEKKAAKVGRACMPPQCCKSAACICLRHGMVRYGGALMLPLPGLPYGVQSNRCKAVGMHAETLARACSMQAPPAAVVQPPAPTNGHGEPARKRARSTSPNGQAARPERHGRQALFLFVRTTVSSCMAKCTGHAGPDHGTSMIYLHVSICSYAVMRPCLRTVCISLNSSCCTCCREEARNGHSERNGHARSNGHGEHRHHDDRDRDRNGHREGDRHGYRSGRDKDEAAAANGHGSKQHHGGGRHEREEEARPRVHIDGASAQRGADLKYGLNYGGTAPEALQGHDRCGDCRPYAQC